MFAGRLGAVGVFAFCALVPSLTTPAQVEGVVLHEGRPVAGAWAGVQGQSAPFQLTDAQGRYRPSATTSQRPLVAWKNGFRIASATPWRAGSVSDRSSVSARRNVSPITLELCRLPVDDNEDYAWIDPAPSSKDRNRCSRCHGTIFGEWATSAHARAARNPKFLGLYAGMKSDGGEASTWNLQREYPEGAGVCASCHAPTMRSPDLSYDLRHVDGVAAQGVHCDYCHKIVDAPTDKLGTRFGRDGLTLLRPAQDDALFFGPLLDAVRPGESFGFARVYKESRYCASCHEGVIFGTHVYGTYSEWLESPARARGVSCQQCHMTPTGQLTNIAPGHGGIERNPLTLASHHFPGGQLDMLKRCLKVQADAVLEGNGTHVNVAIEAEAVGHRVPTGFIDRHLVLTVEAFDADGRTLEPGEGSRLPSYAGLGKTAGRLFAKVLYDNEGHGPLPFWRPHARMADSRLRPGRTEEASFRFPGKVSKVRVRLLYRRFWPEVAGARGWHDNERVVYERNLAPGAASKTARSDWISE